MQLASDILIERTPQQVWAFLGDPANVAKWDRGVARVEETAMTQRGVGYEFETVAHERFNLADQGRMSYRIKEVDEENGRCVVELTSTTGNARFFRQAEWRFDVCAEGGSSRLTCTAAFELRWHWLILAPLLYLKRTAILLDLTLLKAAVESQFS
ncbi:MAG TPA: SRPBCC family protein [Terracidiphilus sp.]|nr:SRPBCC family protein [Terracidiphilus sp.]